MIAAFYACDNPISFFFPSFCYEMVCLLDQSTNISGGAALSPGESPVPKAHSRMCLEALCFMVFFFFVLDCHNSFFDKFLTVYGFITAISGAVASRISCQPNFGVINSYFLCLPRLYRNDKTHYY